MHERRGASHALGRGDERTSIVASAKHFSTGPSNTRRQDRLRAVGCMAPDASRWRSRSTVAAAMRLLSIADTPTDDDDARLRKRVGVAAGFATVIAPLTLPLQAPGQPLAIVFGSRCPSTASSTSASSLGRAISSGT